MIPLIFCLLALCLPQILAVDLVVDLGYAKYLGVNQTDGTYRWAGMRFARSVSRIDGNRFAAPQDPLPMRGIVNASEYGPLCIGSASNLKYEFGDRWSEDCLFANVFAPADATTNSSLPVYIFIQGGGFNLNGNADYNGADLIEAAKNQIVVVNFNYRVGPYGFLASQEIVDDDDLSLNNGLKDQRQLMKWVKDHIQQFGGNPNHVTLGGASAGAASVVLQLTAYGGRDDKLFQAAAAESQAFPPIRNVTDMQWAYDGLLKKTGCQNITCLKELDAISFQTAVRSFKPAFPGGKSPPLFFWNPTLDYDFIRDYTYNEVNAGHFVKVPTIFGDTTNEGLGFTSSNINSVQSALQFVVDQFPNLDKTDFARIRDVWPGPINFQHDPAWRNVASDIYGHIRYICPGLNISHAYAEYSLAPTWQYRWNVGKALHVEELGPIWNNGSTPARVFMQSYMASFIRSYNPTQHVTEYLLSSGTELTSPDWTTFGKTNGQRLLFANENDVGMEDVSQEERNKCDVITELGIQLEQRVRSAGYLLTPTWSTAYLTCFVSILCFTQWLCS